MAGRWISGARRRHGPSAVRFAAESVRGNPRTSDRVHGKTAPFGHRISRLVPRCGQERKLPVRGLGSVGPRVGERVWGVTPLLASTAVRRKLDCLAVEHRGSADELPADRGGESQTVFHDLCDAVDATLRADAQISALEAFPLFLHLCLRVGIAAITERRHTIIVASAVFPPVPQDQ